MIFVQRLSVVHASQHELRRVELHETHDRLEADEDEGDETETPVDGREVWVGSFVVFYIYSSASSPHLVRKVVVAAEWAYQ